MRTGIRAIAPHAVERYGSVCADLGQVGVDGGSPSRRRLTVARLREFGDLVVDERLAGTSPIDVEPAGTLDGFDDDELVEWWSDGCWIGEVLWNAAAVGSQSSIDAIRMLTEFARLGAAPGYASLLAEETERIARLVVAVRVNAGDRVGLADVGSPGVEEFAGRSDPRRTVVRRQRIL